MGVERLGRRSRAGEVTDPANLDGVIGDAVIGTAVQGCLGRNNEFAGSLAGSAWCVFVDDIGVGRRDVVGVRVADDGDLLRTSVTEGVTRQKANDARIVGH